MAMFIAAYNTLQSIRMFLYDLSNKFRSYMLNSVIILIKVNGGKLSTPTANLTEHLRLGMTNVEKYFNKKMNF